MQIGWSTQVFTPDRPAMLRGQKYRRVATDAMDPLTVTALAISDAAGGTDVVLVSLDIIGVRDNTLAAIRRRVEELVPALSGEQVIVCATHTHSSLETTAGTYEHPGGDVLTPAECEEIIANATADAVADAWEDRQPGAIGRAFDHAVVGHNRYAVYENGHAEMYGATDRDDFVQIGGYEDHSVDMLFTWDEHETLTGVALAVACPSQVDEHSERYTADYWHDVRVALRKRLGPDVAVLPLCSAAGDQSPHFLLYDREERDMRARSGQTEREAIATKIATAVERSLPSAEPLTTQAISHERREFRLDPLRISEADRDAARVELENLSPAEQTSNWGERLVEVRDGEYTNEGVPIDIETHHVRIGDLALVTNPFELFLDYGLRITARSPAAQTITVQLSCGSEGYLPTAVARERGGYGAIPPSATVGPVGGTQLVEGTLTALQDIF